MVNVPNNNEKAKVQIRSLAHNNEVVIFFPYDFEFDDQYKPEWGTYEGFGRMDPIMSYKRTTRDVNLSFNVVAEDLATATTNFEQLQKLINFLYPVYDDPFTKIYNSNITNVKKTKASEEEALKKATDELNAKQEQLTQRFGNKLKLTEEEYLQLSEEELSEIVEGQQEEDNLKAQRDAIASEIQKSESLIAQTNQNREQLSSFNFGVLNKSPLFEISFMNLLQTGHFVAAITNFKHKMKFDTADTYFTAQGSAVPGEFSISVSFKVLHKYVPGTKNNYS